MKLSEDELKAWGQLMEDFDEALTLSEQVWLSASQTWEAALIRY